MSDREILHSSVDIEVRSVDAEKRQATFVASTENAIRTWGDPEVLRMDGVNLDRYRKNPVLLDTHGRYGLESVIGSCSVSRSGAQLHATATYATTERGEQAWRLVKEGHVRAMSIGYSVDATSVKRLRAGERDGEVEGPATIANKWTLLEISNVPVPADQDAVRRSFYERHAPMADIITRAMAEAPASVPAPAVAVATPTAPAPPVVASRSDAEQLRRDITAITPPGFEQLAAKCILRGLSFEASRAELLAAWTAKYEPVGTPEPAPQPAPKANERKELPEWVTDDVLVRSLSGL